MEIHDAPVREIEAVTLYRILALRTDVFVVEQDCAYLDLDGRDIEDTARLLWAQDGDTIAATLRTLVEPDGTIRIGRVTTARAQRGQGIAAQLIAHALESNPGRSFALNAQSQLEAWYARFGFVRSGPDFDEDGLPHTPMLRP